MLDFYLEVAKGNITGHSSINKFGANGAVGTSSTETVWDGSSLYTFPTTADITHLRQATDQATMRGEDVEIQGLADDYSLVVQTVTLDASDTTTAVALGTALRRVFRMKVLSAVVTTQNVELRNVGGGTTYSVIVAGNNQTQMAVYTVPSGSSGYVDNYWCSLDKAGGGGDPDVHMSVWNRDNTNGYAPQLKHELGLDANATSYFQHFFTPPLKLLEKTDIWINCENLSSTAAADVTAGFDIILVAD